MDPLTLILIVVLVMVLFGAFTPQGRQYGAPLSGIVGIVLLIVIIAYLL